MRKWLGFCIYNTRGLCILRFALQLNSTRSQSVPDLVKNMLAELAGNAYLLFLVFRRGPLILLIGLQRHVIVGILISHIHLIKRDTIIFISLSLFFSRFEM